MLPQRPTTRQSSKTLKGRSEQTREFFSSVVKALEFSPKTEPMIKMSQKKSANPPPLYKDTNVSTTSKVLMPTWINLYNKIHYDEFPEFTPYSDSEVRVLDNQVFHNIKRSLLYLVASKTLFFPCMETLEWIIHHNDADK
jgi:hypothetical protein